MEAFLGARRCGYGFGEWVGEWVWHLLFMGGGIVYIPFAYAPFLSSPTVACHLLVLYLDSACYITILARRLGVQGVKK